MDVVCLFETIAAPSDKKIDAIFIVGVGRRAARKIFNNSSFQKFDYFLICIILFSGIIIKCMYLWVLLYEGLFNFAFKKVYHPFRKPMELLQVKPQRLRHFLLSSFMKIGT